MNVIFNPTSTVCNAGQQNIKLRKMREEGSGFFVYLPMVNCIRRRIRLRDFVLQSKNHSQGGRWRKVEFTMKDLKDFFTYCVVVGDKE